MFLGPRPVLPPSHTCSQDPILCLSPARSPLSARGHWHCVLYRLLFLATQTISEDGTHRVEEPGKLIATWVQFLLHGWKARGFRHERSRPRAQCGV